MVYCFASIRSNPQGHFQPVLVEPFDRHCRWIVADDGHGHGTEAAREQIVISLEIQLDVAADEWNARL